MNRDPETGRFIGETPKAFSCDLASLPETNEKVINLYQEYDILPQTMHGMDLILTKSESQGDLLNDLWTFYSTSGRCYPSVRSIINHQARIPLVLGHKILYMLLLNIPHQAIATMIGWKYTDSKGTIRYKTQPIIRLRSNNSFFLFKKIIFVFFFSFLSLFCRKLSHVKYKNISDLHRNLP